MDIRNRVKKLERVRITKGLLPVGNPFGGSMTAADIDAFLENFI